MAALQSGRLVSSFAGVHYASHQPHFFHLFRFHPGRQNVCMQFSRSLSDMCRNRDQLSTSGRKRLRPGKLSPRRLVPSHIQRPPYVDTRAPPGLASGHEVHDEEGIECMRASGRLAARVLEYAGTLVKPGVKTDEIDEAVHQMIIDNGGYPSPLGYGGFPKSVCTSVNECICHGIPDSRPLEDGDIINIDVTAYLNGYHGDTSATFFCGEVSDEARKLVKVMGSSPWSGLLPKWQGKACPYYTLPRTLALLGRHPAPGCPLVTKECLDKAITICGPGVEYKKIGKTIHDHADKYRYGVVRQFVGHGVGRVFHADPVIQHFRNNDGGQMILNQTFTIGNLLICSLYVLTFLHADTTTMVGRVGGCRVEGWGRREGWRVSSREVGEAGGLEDVEKRGGGGRRVEGLCAEERVLVVVRGVW
ncbi:hypothetical protein KSS87_012836 [Heliosperma pusillum]|nr:hypothetical protein KSS87_012836 [Heliosperma pusillum]